MLAISADPGQVVPKTPSTWISNVTKEAASHILHFHLPAMAIDTSSRQQPSPLTAPALTMNEVHDVLCINITKPCNAQHLLPAAT